MSPLRMRPTLVLLLVLLPSLALGQSLAEAAKKEKERREKNKQEGRKVHVFSETDIFPEEEEGASEGETAGVGAEGAQRSSTYVPSLESRLGEITEDETADDRAPTHIPPELEIGDRIAIFERMKRNYQSQVEQIDEQIAKNEARISELDAEIGATSALGGAGLPVAPQTGTGNATRPMTGQESVSLVAEQNRLRTVNDELRRRKDQLKLDLVSKGRAAGIPAGYLRF